MEKNGIQTGCYKVLLNSLVYYDHLYLTIALIFYIPIFSIFSQGYIQHGNHNSAGFQTEGYKTYLLFELNSARFYLYKITTISVFKTKHLHIAKHTQSPNEQTLNVRHA